MNKLLRFVLLVVGAIAGYMFFSFLGLVTELSLQFSELITNYGFYGAIIGGVIGFILLPIIITRLSDIILNAQGKLEKVPLKDIIAGVLGLVMGLLLGVLLSLSFSVADIPRFGMSIQIALNLFLAYLGFNLGLNKREELFNFIKLKSKSSSATINSDNNDDSNDIDDELKASYKVVDTSAIIDGRIADVCKTDFMEGTLIIPEFILEELQHIADSSDLLKRNRGRRGLDILKTMQNDVDITVKIHEQDFEEIKEVDSKLVKLAKLLDGKVVTNDYNLNKVAELQGVSVLNINELANAVKPVVLPGEEMEVKIIKDGKEPGQGVGYLDDGTMIVVDEARDYIGEEIEILVTSILQTAAGRMIFAKPNVNAQQAL